MNISRVTETSLTFYKLDLFIGCRTVFFAFKLLHIDWVNLISCYEAPLGEVGRSVSKWVISQINKIGIANHFILKAKPPKLSIFLKASIYIYLTKLSCCVLLDLMRSNMVKYLQWRFFWATYCVEEISCSRRLNSIYTFDFSVELLEAWETWMLVFFIDKSTI